MARLFTGIFPPDYAASDVLALRETGSDGDVRWIPPSNVHATLVFIGGIPDDDVPAICRALRSVRFRAFDLAVSGVGAFPNPVAARVLWAGLEPVDPVRKLRRTVLDALSSTATGLKEDSRTYHPHMTIARPKGRRKIDARPWIDRFSGYSGPTFRVESFALVDSRTKPQGAEYTVIGRFPPFL